MGAFVSRGVRSGVLIERRARWVKKIGTRLRDPREAEALWGLLIGWFWTIAAGVVAAAAERDTFPESTGPSLIETGTSETVDHLEPLSCQLLTSLSTANQPTTFPLFEAILDVRTRLPPPWPPSDKGQPPISNPPPQNIAVRSLVTRTRTMALPRSLLQYVCSLILLACTAQALKFDLHATPANSNKERCVRNFVAKDTLVVVTATVGGSKGDGMTINMRVCGRSSIHPMVTRVQSRRDGFC